MSISPSGKNVLAIIFLIACFVPYVFALTPAGPQITYTNIEDGTVRSSAQLNTSGGTITTMVLNTTTQNPHWKAYVGNVTGKYILEDAQNYSIYEWSLSSVAGEVYVTRNSTVNWTGIRCANTTDVSTEETAMNHTSTADDSIRNTFTRTTHRHFWTATTEFAANQCNYTLYTYVNDTSQSTSSNFQEILLWDGTAMVYTTILENKTFGFDRGYYDFQMLVPEKGWDAPVTSTPYYFYVELA